MHFKIDAFHSYEVNQPFEFFKYFESIFLIITSFIEALPIRKNKKLKYLDGNNWPFKWLISMNSSHENPLVVNITLKFGNWSRQDWTTSRTFSRAWKSFFKWKTIDKMNWLNAFSQCSGSKMHWLAALTKCTD